MFTIFFSSCKEDEIISSSYVNVNILEKEVEYTNARIMWSVSTDATISNVLFEYATDTTFVKSVEVPMTSTVNRNNFYAILDTLKDGVKYYIRCKVVNKYNSLTSDIFDFTTKKYRLAEIQTDDVTQIDISSADVHAKLLERRTDKSTMVGFYFATHPDVTEEDSCIIVNHALQKDSVEFDYSLSDLEDGTTYYVRAFAKNNVGISFGEEKSFVTTEMLPPTVGAVKVTSISYTEAFCSSQVNTDGGGDVVERGFCYSTKQDPTIETGKIISGKGLGLYSSKIVGLSAGTLYYIRAYATNKKGTAYGEQTSFTTEKYTAPSVTTLPATEISYTSANCGGEVTADGGQTIIERGICFSTSELPTISDNKVICGSGSGNYNGKLDGLFAGTIYYVRAYATNSIGTSYGDNIEFTTTAYTLPIVMISTIKDITCTTAICEGNVTDAGGQEVTERGFCYSTMSNPSINNNKISNTGGLGSFSCNLSNLTENTKYYICAYAINTVGVAYSEQLEFSTPESGLLHGVFSVSSTKKVRFSKGNLQYQASTNTWHFSSSQWFLYEKVSPSSISSTNAGWIELFGWGTSGYNNKYPYMTNNDGSMYGNGQNDISGTNYDWGRYISITNGGNQKNIWRTLMNDEWNYLIQARSDDGSRLYGMGNINGYNGVILLPDDWVTPSGITFISRNDVKNSNFSDNSYTLAEWAIMESAGAVFLPAGGNRWGVSLSGYNENGNYWSSSSTNNSTSSALYVTFDYSGMVCCGSASRSMGCNVRLVQDVQ